MTLPRANRMTVPAGILDSTSQILVDLIESRFGAVPIAAIITCLLENVDASVLPALGWTFDVPPAAWSAADTIGRRAIIQQAIDKARRRGVPGQVKRALSEALGLSAHIDKNPALYADGSVVADGTFHAGANGQPLTFWLVLTVDRLTPDEAQAVVSIVEEWKRKSAHLSHIYYVSGQASFGDFYKYWSDTTIELLTTEDGLVITTEDGVPIAV